MIRLKFGNYARVWHVLLLGSLMIGCGGPAGPKVYPVNGIVTLDDKPIKGAVVKMYDVTNKNNPCAGTSDAEGKFKMAFSQSDGASPGTYKVTIEYFTDMEGKPLVETPGKDPTMLVMERKAKQALPPTYSDFNQTKLTQEVKPEVNNVQFKLKSDGS